MSGLRLIAWNCHHGSLSQRLAELAAHSPDIVFLQECLPAETLSIEERFLPKRIGAGRQEVEHL